MVHIGPRILKGFVGVNAFWMSLTAVVGLQIYMAQLLGDQTADLMRLQLTFDPTSFATIFHGWTEGQYQAYRRHFIADFVYPFAYAVFLYNCLVSSVKRIEPTQFCETVLYVPLLAAVADYTENILHLIMTEKNLLAHAHLVPWAGAAACVKWLSLATIVGTILACRTRSWS
ncbi:MAG: hypothetical protein VYA30_00800 [Myxococcota bacterium]|nr:hypothetical protein [Myxococcota bacterium]